MPAQRHSRVRFANDAAYVAESDRLLITGQRLCPNLGCRTHVFVVYELETGEPTVVCTYPAERIDFDASNVPKRVIATFEEAITCHANECWTAAAIMVRKTLEELCSDQNAEGDTLFKRIEALRETAVLPKALLGGLDALRVLGNDAAHLESRVYEQIGQQEVELGIAVAKEILKATYQMGSIVEQLTALQRQRNEADSGG